LRRSGRLWPAIAKDEQLHAIPQERASGPLAVGEELWRYPAFSCAWLAEHAILRLRCAQPAAKLLPGLRHAGYLHYKLFPHVAFTRVISGTYICDSKHNERKMPLNALRYDNMSSCPKGITCLNNFHRVSFYIYKFILKLIDGPQSSHAPLLWRLERCKHIFLWTCLSSCILLLLSVACSSPAFATINSGTSVVGGSIRGWAYDTAAPTQELSIEIYLDGPIGIGTYQGSVQTTILRNDINTRYAIQGYHGYTWSITIYNTENLHIWYVYSVSVSGTVTFLWNGTYPSIYIHSTGTPQVVVSFAQSACDAWDFIDSPPRAFRTADGNVNLTRISQTPISIGEA